MIPNAPENIRKIHQQALEMDSSMKHIDIWTLRQMPASETREELERRSLWSAIFRAAKSTAAALNRQNKDKVYQRDFTAEDIVNHWYLDLESTSQVTHDFRAHDRCTGFLTIGQELKELEKQENRENYETWERLYREWWFGGKQGPKPRMPKPIHYAIVNYEDHETFSEGAWSELDDDVESLETLRERKQDFYQTPNEDPENPLEDALGCRRLAVRHTVRQTAHGIVRDKRYMYRGSRGVLNGVYSNTNPEPAYRTPQGRYRLNKALLNSDNLIDVQIARYMSRSYTFDPVKRHKRNLQRLES